MSSASSFSSLSRSAVHRRAVRSASDPITSPGAVGSAAYSGPAPRGIWQLLAIGFVIFLGLLQFLPATHFRDPFDPFRKWVPYQTNLSSSAAILGMSAKNLSLVGVHGGESTLIHIASWMDCLNLQLFAVLINSTLSSTRYPELVSFHFFVPEGRHDKVSYYKLKVLFPHTNLEFIGQEKVRRQIMTAYDVGEYTGPSFDAIAPYVIPFVHPQLSNFIYVSPNAIIRGNVEKLLKVKLNDYPIAVAEDCSKRLHAYVNSDVLDAIQRSAAKPWVSGTPYARDACMPMLGLLVINASRLEKDFVESILWWSRVLNKNERSHPHPAVALALYNRHLTLPNSWRANDLAASDIDSEILVFHHGGSSSFCSDSGDAVTIPDFGNTFKQYLPPMSDQILGLH